MHFQRTADCVVSVWSEWDACSVPCGGGERSHTRTIVTQPAYNGRACPDLVEKDSSPCNPQLCTGKSVFWLLVWLVACGCSTLPNHFLRRIAEYTGRIGHVHYDRTSSHKHAHTYTRAREHEHTHAHPRIRARTHYPTNTHAHAHTNSNRETNKQISTPDSKHPHNVCTAPCTDPHCSTCASSPSVCTACVPDTSATSAVHYFLYENIHTHTHPHAHPNPHIYTSTHGHTHTHPPRHNVKATKATNLTRTPIHTQTAPCTDPHCSTCASSPSVCTACAPDTSATPAVQYFLYQNACVQKCPDAYYPDAPTSTCKGVYVFTGCGLILCCIEQNVVRVLA